MQKQDIKLMPVKIPVIWCACWFIKRDKIIYTVIYSMKLELQTENLKWTFA